MRDNGGTSRVHREDETVATLWPKSGGSVRTKTLMACVELGRTLSRKINPDAFLFKVTKGSETTK
jgi:hypothetical protein